VDEARQREFARPRTAADRAFGLEHYDLTSCLRQDDGGAQTVRSRADDDRIDHPIITITGPMPEYWYSRWLFERALAAVYLAAFLAAAKQFVPLLGQHGLEPVGRWIQSVPFRASPSLFWLLPRDSVFQACAWLGVALSVFALSSLPPQLGAVASAAVWAALWMLYLSFVNVGAICFQTVGLGTFVLSTTFTSSRRPKNVETAGAGGRASSSGRSMVRFRWLARNRQAVP
jgi:hypothetical protein